VKLEGLNMATANNPMTGEAKLGLAWKQSLLLGVVVLGVYSVNGREIPNWDTMASKLLPVALLRGDGPFLDRFGPVLLPEQGSDEPLPYYLAWERSHLVSTYPLGNALVAVPFYLPQVLVLDWFRPGWEKREVAFYTSWMGKNTAAALGALTAVAIFHLLRRLGLGRLAWPTALATALASNLWADSQTLWQHVPAALALTLALALLVPPPVSRLRLGLAGLATAALVWIRPQDLLLAAVIFLWVSWHQPRDLRWFIPVPLLLGGALAGYNYWFFGTLAGGYGIMPGTEYISLRPASFLEAVAGNLWSPRRSLFFYCPWVALALATVPAVAGRLKAWSMGCWLLWALIPYLVLYSLNTGWWGGHYFGPRYFTDVVPLFAVLLGFGLGWSWARCRPVLVGFVITLAFATGVQWVGAFCYPSSWGTTPVEIDATVEAGNSERAWDWHDNELRRLWAEGPQKLEGWAWWSAGFANYLPAPDVFPVYHPGTRVDFTQASSRAYLQGVWYEPEPEGSWSGREVAIGFRLDPVQPLRLRMMAATYGKQRIVIRFNGQDVQTLQGSGDGLELLEVDLPTDAIAESNTLQLTLPDAKSPKSVGENADDPRILGIEIAWLEFVPQPTYRPGTRIDFTQASSRDYLHGAWYGPEPEWQWSGREAAIGFRLERVQPLRLRMKATTFGKQRIVLRLNGREVQTLQGNGEALELLEVDLPRDAIAESNTLELTLPDAKSPESAKVNPDPRILGIGIAWLEFQPLRRKN
jgi:hypothetical protein